MEAPVGPQDEMNQDPPPWVPADKQHTTAATPDNAQLHLLRAVETGIINVSPVMLSRDASLTNALALPRCTGVGREAWKVEKPAQE